MHKEKGRYVYNLPTVSKHPTTYLANKNTHALRTAAAYNPPLYPVVPVPVVSSLLQAFQFSVPPPVPSAAVSPAFCLNLRG